MDKEQYRAFASKTESLARPEDVTAISFLGDFNRLLPKKAQDKIMQKGNKDIPYMGFIVDPYCAFLAYRIKDEAMAQAMLPPEYELAASSLFSGGEKAPLVIFSAFTARTSAFSGMRLEMYLTARHRETGLMSWIIADYVTNTNSHDPRNGFCGYNADSAVFTTTPYGELLVDVRRRQGESFALSMDIASGQMMPLDQELWVEGNLSVDYGGALLDKSSHPFGLIFDPVLMKEALKLPAGGFRLAENSFLAGLIEGDTPLEAALFPYSQHFIIKQHMRRDELLQEADLKPLLQEYLDRREFKTMRGDDLKKPLLRGMLISAALNYGLIIFLLIKYVF